ncbi:MAG: SbmA/BacA-like family transporter [Hyphomicrobiaceae bacterium]
MTERLEQQVLPEAGANGSATRFLRFASGFWYSGSARYAWLLASAIVVLVLMNLLVNIGLNRWQRWFFDMLEKRDSELLLRGITILLGLVLAGAGFAVAMVKCQMTLQIDWRKWVTDRIIEDWRKKSESTSPDVPDENPGSPEFRLAQDVRLALEPAIELTVGFTSALLLATTFVGVLSLVGGSAHFSLWGREITIPAYLAIAALLYASILTPSVYLVGQPLVRRLAQKNEAESRLLFEITKVVESDFPPGAPAHRGSGFDRVTEALDVVMARWRQVIREYCRVTWLANGNTFFSPVLPLLLTAPKYMAGELSLGEIMQVASAFTVVLGSLNWLSDNYIKAAEWAASARRVDELRQALSPPEKS